MEDGDQGNWRVWHKLLAKKYEEEAYAWLNVHVDEYTGENLVEPQKVDTAVTRPQVPNSVEEDNGALRMILETYKLGKTVIQKRGWKFKLPGPRHRWCDSMLMGYDCQANNLKHVNYGLGLG
ncbi:hypothetical protein C8Q74DRAFT_1372542 [Fomes fomentarius]|nr:hypothetical protein C8Q74DRAFT_1372542 [Fomes fomentarius]